jgi:hypothetical protein
LYYIKFILVIFCYWADISLAGDIGYMLDSEDRICEYDDSCGNILPFVIASIIAGFIAKQIDRNVERSILNGQPTNLYVSVYFLEFCAVVGSGFYAKDVIGFIVGIIFLQLWVFFVHLIVQESP